MLTCLKWSPSGGTLIFYCLQEPQVAPCYFHQGWEVSKVTRGDWAWPLLWKSDTCGPWPLLSPSQNVCAGAAINRAVLTQRCNPRRLSLGLICITLSGARERDAPREGRGLCRGFGLVPSVLARGGDYGQSWVMICHRKERGVSLCRGNLGRD